MRDNLTVPKGECRCGAVDYLVRGLCFDCWTALASGAPMRPERALAIAVDFSRSTPATAVAPSTYTIPVDPAVYPELVE